MERYWLIGGGAILAVLLAASIALAIGRGETQLDPGTPEYAVQQYLTALVQEDFEAAEAIWSPDLQEDCSFQAFVVDARRSLDNLSESKITLDKAQVVGDTTIVTIRVVRTTGGSIFGPSESDFSYDYGLRMFDGDWKITGHTWPSDRCIRSHFVPERTPPTPSPGID